MNVDELIDREVASALIATGFNLLGPDMTDAAPRTRLSDRVSAACDTRCAVRGPCRAHCQAPDTCVESSVMTPSRSYRVR